MASPSTPVHPARYLSIFLALLVGVYLLVFLTGDKNPEPKLGIGARVLRDEQVERPAGNRLRYLEAARHATRPSGAVPGARAGAQAAGTAIPGAHASAPATRR